MDHVNDDDQYHQELESLDTLSLTDFPLTPDVNSGFQDHDNKHQSPPSPAVTDQDLFEFCSGRSTVLSEDHMIMSHAEDMISGGKLIPIKDQQNQKDNTKHNINRARCESMRELKSMTNKGTTSQVFRNSKSFDCKKLNRNSNSRSNNFEPTGDSNRNSLSTKTSSSRWSDLVFAPLKVPQEMDLKDIRNRQVVQNTSKSLFPAVQGGSDHFAVNGDHRKSTSWGVLGFLSCKRSGSVAVTTPFG